MFSLENNKTVSSRTNSSDLGGGDIVNDLVVESRDQSTSSVEKIMSDISWGDWLEVRQVDTVTGKLVDFMYESMIALTKTVMFCATALVLGILPGKGVGNLWPPFRSQVFGPEISTYFLDPYSFLHFEDGIIAFLLWGNVESSLFASHSAEFKAFWDDFGGLMAGLLAGYLFEVFENSEFIINRFVRDHGTSQFYEGDSKINVFGDILSLGVGYSMSKVSTAYGFWWFPWVWLILSEMFCALTFHDNLVLGVIQTVAPQEWIKDYQQELVPPHLRGIMRAGYWDRKLDITRLRRLWIGSSSASSTSDYQNIQPDLSSSAHAVSKKYWPQVQTSFRRL